MTHPHAISRRGFLAAAATSAAALGLSACSATGSEPGASPATTAPASTSTSSTTASGYVIDGVDYAKGTHHATIEVEGYGTMSLELFATNTPVTVGNFCKLASEGFYDALTFHRIIKGFMIQGGDPKGDGTGGSNQTIVGEFSSNGHPNPISHERGTISMARSSAPNSASSQFFIMQEDTPSLDGDYAAFGHVTEGIEVVDAICDAARPVDGNGTIPADQQPRIASVKLVD